MRRRIKQSGCLETLPDYLLPADRRACSSIYADAPGFVGRQSACYNIGLVTRPQAEDGWFTPEMIAKITA